MNEPLVSIIMRSYNEAWALKGTLPALKAQDYTNWELIVIDSGSTDGSPDLIRAASPQHFIEIKPHEYNPSRVMNHGMRLARSEYCIFINADATPQGSNWLCELVTALQQPNVAAVFGRQIPRPDCKAVFACDYDRCFGDQRDSSQWDHFFSMVSSGLKKEIWAIRGFREDLQYAEDDEYTRWCKSSGYEVRYVPSSVAMHSHNYTPDQTTKRVFEDARSIGKAWKGDPNFYTWPKNVLLGWLRDLSRDVKFCATTGRLHELPHSAQIRWRQRTAKLAGFRYGLKEQAAAAKPVNASLNQITA